MTEWAVFGVIAAIAGLFVTVGKPIIDLNRTLTRLETKMGEMETKYDNLENHGTEARRRLWLKNEEQDRKLCDHESRICALEQKE